MGPHRTRKQGRNATPATIRWPRRRPRSPPNHVFATTPTIAGASSTGPWLGKRHLCDRASQSSLDLQVRWRPSDESASLGTISLPVVAKWPHKDATKWCEHEMQWHDLVNGSRDLPQCLIDVAGWPRDLAEWPIDAARWPRIWSYKHTPAKVVRTKDRWLVFCVLWFHSVNLFLIRHERLIAEDGDLKELEGSSSRGRPRR